MKNRRSMDHSSNKRSIFRRRNKSSTDEKASTFNVPLLSASETSMGSQDPNRLEGTCHFPEPKDEGKIKAFSAKLGTINWRACATRCRCLLSSQEGIIAVTAFVVSAAVRSSRPLLFMISALCLRDIIHYASIWIRYFCTLPGARLAAHYRRSWFRTINNEGERLVSGDYSRQLAVAYAISVYTTPGESAIAKFIRFKASLINQEIVSDLTAWREKRLGYKSSRS